jgi:hypothetical protein
LSFIAIAHAEGSSATVYFRLGMSGRCARAADDRADSATGVGWLPIELLEHAMNAHRQSEPRGSAWQRRAR